MLSEVRAIVREVSKWTDVPVHRIMSPGRQPRVTFARREVIRRLAAAGRSRAKIARVLNLDHSTVWHVLEKHRETPRFPWHKPRVKELRGRLWSLWHDLEVQDLSFMVFPTRKGRNPATQRRYGTNKRAGTAHGASPGP